MPIDTQHGKHGVRYEKHETQYKSKYAFGFHHEPSRQLVRRGGTGYTCQSHTAELVARAAPKRSPAPCSPYLQFTKYDGVRDSYRPTLQCTPGTVLIQGAIGCRKGGGPSTVYSEGATLGSRQGSQRRGRKSPSAGSHKQSILQSKGGSVPAGSRNSAGSIPLASRSSTGSWQEGGGSLWILNLSTAGSKPDLG